jgi:hypothetical protein
MKKSIKILIKHYGGSTEAAKALGITPRHFLNVRNGKFVGRFLELQIKRMAFDINNKAV